MPASRCQLTGGRDFGNGRNCYLKSGEALKMGDTDKQLSIEH